MTFHEFRKKKDTKLVGIFKKKKKKCQKRKENEFWIRKEGRKKP